MNGKVKSVAAPPSETRNIVIAQGVEFNNKELPAEDRIPDGSLKKRMDAAGLKLVITSPGNATFQSLKQGVNFTIKVVNTKSELKAALESDKTHHVIYDGHSRFGRGCCFGTNSAPGEDWENGSNPKTTGLFRMGFPYVAVPLKDIGHHFYTTDIVPISETLTPSDCEPDLRSAVNGKLVKAHTLADCDKEYRAILAAELKKPLADRESLEPDVAKVLGKLRMNKAAVKASDKFWAFQWGGEGFSLVLHAGWEKTASAPMDLGATDIKCRVFCHFGCSSFQHYHEIVRNRKKWKKVSNTDNFAYFTSGLSYSFTGPNWLFHLLSYDQFNAGQPWEPSLEYARKKANLDIKKDCLRIKEPIYEIL